MIYSSRHSYCLLYPYLPRLSLLILASECVFGICFLHSFSRLAEFMPYYFPEHFRIDRLGCRCRSNILHSISVALSICAAVYILLDVTIVNVALVDVNYCFLNSEQFFSSIPFLIRLSVVALAHISLFPPRNVIDRSLVVSACLVG